MLRPANTFGSSDLILATFTSDDKIACQTTLLCATRSLFFFSHSHPGPKYTHSLIILHLSNCTPFLSLTHKTQVPDRDQDSQMVRLITHNLLACHAKGCTTNNFPLELKDVEIELREAEFNSDFLRGFMSRIEWRALVDAARQVRLLPSLYPPLSLLYENKRRVVLMDCWD